MSHPERRGPTPKFWSGICEGCRKPYVRRSCKAPKFCNDRCARRCWARRHRRQGAERTYADRKAEYRDRVEAIAVQVATGELTLVPGNCCRQCSTPDHPVEVEAGTDPWTGRTWEYCPGCGFRWLGQWRSAA